MTPVKKREQPLLVERDSLGNRIPSDAMVIRATELTEFFGCKRAWFFSSHNGMNLEPLVKNEKLRFGTIWHYALEKHYCGEDMMKAFDEGFKIEADKIKNQGDVFFGDEVQSELETHWELGAKLVPLYLEWASACAEPSDRDLNYILVEHRILVPVLTPTGRISKTWLAVKVDAVASNEHNNLWIVEHKALSKSTNVNNPEHLPLDIQMGLQIWALKQLPRFNNTNVLGAIYNLTRKQLPSNRVKAPIFGRHPVKRSRTELDRLSRELYNHSMDMRRTVRDPEYRTYNPQPWGGKCTWGCAFRTVCECMNREEDYKFLLQETFKPRYKSIWETLSEEMNTTD